MASAKLDTVVEHFCKPGLIDRTEQLDIWDEICAKSNIHCSPESNLVKFEVPETLITDSESYCHAYFEFGVGYGLTSCANLKKIQ